jgi:hypothetical protein
MATLSIRTLTPASNKAKVSSDERTHFFREYYRNCSLGLAGKKNAFGREYTRVEGGNHTSRKALQAALGRLAESPTSRHDTDLVLIADHSFMKNGLEEERRIIKEGGKDKVAKEEVEREGVQRLLAVWGDRFRKITVLYEKSPEGAQDERELLKQIRSQQFMAENAKDHCMLVLHSQHEITPELYSDFVRSSAGMAP